MLKLTDGEIVRLFLEGSTQEEIGDLAGVSRQRIQQILSHHALQGHHGGASLRETNAKKRLRKINEKCLRIWGITDERRMAIRSAWGYRPFRLFTEHRTNSKKRGIPFLFNFAEWWAMWQQSGHWMDRGRKRGCPQYVMARFCDRGAYEPTNVRIITQSENAKEYHSLRRDAKSSM